jgi:hypothetical protein
MTVRQIFCLEGVPLLSEAAEYENCLSALSCLQFTGYRADVFKLGAMCERIVKYKKT